MRRWLVSATVFTAKTFEIFTGSPLFAFYAFESPRILLSYSFLKVLVLFWWFLIFIKRFRFWLIFKILFLKFRYIIKIVMLYETFNVRVIDLFQLEYLVIRYPKIIFIMNASNVFDYFYHFRVVFFSKKGNYWYAIF